MTPTKRDDFYEELERIEKELEPLSRATQAAVKRLFPTPPTKAQTDAAYADYRRAEAAEKVVFERRQEFLKKYKP